jgi:sugar lactone lactonase YvrE
MTKHPPELKIEASSERQWTGVAVSAENRKFVNFPYWSADVPVSVAEIIDGKAVPYPDTSWNDRNSADHFNAVQSVVIDDKNRLWILDTNNVQFGGVKAPGPMLYHFDLQTNQKVKTYPFSPETYRGNSYFNDMRIDTQRGAAFITDSGNGALIVLDLETGDSRRLLEGHPSVMSEVDHLVCDGIKWNNSVHSDGIALTPDRQYIYYIALTGHTLYRIKTDALLDKTLNEQQLIQQVETVAQVPATDGMMFDQAGNLWMGGLENNSINMRDASGKLHQVIQDPAIRWADSFAIGPEGRIYFTTSLIHLPETDRGEYQVLSIKP